MGISVCILLRIEMTESETVIQRMKNTAFSPVLVIFFRSKINKAFLGRFISVQQECLVSVSKIILVVCCPHHMPKGQTAYVGWKEFAHAKQVRCQQCRCAFVSLTTFRVTLYM